MADEFFTLFKQVDGEAVRVAEIAEVNKRIQEIQQSLTAPPSTPDTLLPATHYKRPTTTELVRVASHKDQMVERANAIAKQAEERMRYLQEGQKEIEQQTRILVNFFQEKAQVALASVGEQIAFAQDLTDGLTSLSLYTGEAVSVHKISQGASADPSIPLHLYQDRLYFDEELAAEGIVGGFDFTEINNLGELFSQNSKIIDRMVPAKRGCVLVRVRREDKLYQLASDGFADMLMNLENKKTYLLIRDGENIYLVHSEITTDKAHHLFPSQSDIDRIFRRFGREVRPEHLDYSKARDDFERNTVFYKRMPLMLWGLNDRQNLFGDFYDKDIHNNWYSEEFQSKHLAYVHDAEGTLTQQRPSLYEWMEEQNSNIQIGSRLVVNWKAIVNPESAPDCYSNRPNHDSKYELQFPPTELFGVALVTAKRNNRLVVRTQAEGWGRSPTKKVRRQVAVDIVRGLALNNAACLCIDDIELADLNYYLESRKERKHYLAYIDLFKMVRDQIEQEEAIQADTHHALINDLLKGVKNEVLAKGR